MRTALLSDDAAAQAAGAAVLGEGGNAVDAVLAAMLAGATRISPAALLGSGVLVVAGPGVGAHMVDGRARAPGLGERRTSAPSDPPVAWRAAVPGLLEGVLTAHNRFGGVGLGTITRAAAVAVREVEAAPAVRARLALVEALPRSGFGSLARLGLVQAALEAAGPSASGVLSRDDLREAIAAPVVPLLELRAEEHQVLLAPPDPVPRFAPPPPPAVPVGCAVAADMHGVTVCGVWAAAPEAVALEGEHGLSLAALANAPTKGVTRRKAGTALPLPVPVAIVRHEGRAWAGLAAAGTGDVESARDAYLRARLAAVGIAYESPTPPVRAARGVTLWVVREGALDVRGVSEAFNH